jgi:guanylate kinase
MTALTQDKSPAFTFTDVKYFHRFTEKDQHEYTPAGQEDLKAWSEMVTLLVYRNVKDGEGLATTASNVLETYKANRAIVVKTDSVPRTQNKPAEHLAVVIFDRPEFIEVAFSRFRMYNGLGSAVVFSHRIYGKAVRDKMQEWLAKNGATIEANLMKWDAMPKL